MSRRSSWSQAMDDVVRQVWRDNLTTGWAAARVGRTRNAVIGRAYRLGLGPHPSAPVRPAEVDFSRSFGL